MFKSELVNIHHKAHDKVNAKIRTGLDSQDGQESKLFFDTAKYRSIDALYAGFLPPSMDADDCYQEAILFMLEKPGMPKAYYEAAIPRVLLTKAQKLKTGPGSGIRGYWKKKGKPIYSTEISLETLVSDGQSWEEFISGRQGDDCMEVSFLTLTLDDAASCLTDIRRQQKNPDDTGISFAKTRQKYHLECVVQKQKQFIGQYLTIESAREAKQKFLYDLMDAILDAADNQNNDG